MHITISIEVIVDLWINIEIQYVSDLTADDRTYVWIPPAGGVVITIHFRSIIGAHNYKVTCNYRNLFHYTTVTEGKYHRMGWNGGRIGSKVDILEFVRYCSKTSLVYAGGVKTCANFQKHYPLAPIHRPTIYVLVILKLKKHFSRCKWESED